MRSVMLRLVAASFLVSACGQTGDSSAVSIDSSVVKSQSSALATAIDSAEQNGGTDIAEQLSEIGNTAAALIPRTKGAARAQIKSGASASTCKCTTASQQACTFASCKIGNATASGSLSWADGKLVCSNVVFDVAATGQSTVEGQSVTIGATHIEVTCSFAYATGSIDGSLHTTGSTEVNDVAYSWDASLTASDVTWSSKAFTAGTVDVVASVTTTSAAEGTDTFHATGSVSFP